MREKMHTQHMPRIPRLLYKKKAKKKVKIPVSSLLFLTWLITRLGQLADDRTVWTHSLNLVVS
jgi:hypothetical protein